MPYSSSLRPRDWHNSIAFALLAFAVLIALAYVTGVYVKHETDALTQAASDNRTWSVAQLEVDHQELAIALLMATVDTGESQDAALKRVATRAAILQSRIRVVLATLDNIGQNSQETSDFLNNLYARLDRFLSQGAANPNEISQMLAMVRQEAPEVRKITITELDYSNRQAMDRRDRYNRLLFQVALINGALLAALVATLSIIWTLLVRLRSRAISLDNLAVDLRATLDACFYGTMITDISGQVTEMNAVALDMFGLEIPDLAKISVFDVLRDEKGQGGSATDWWTEIRSSSEIMPVTRKRLQGHISSKKIFPVEVSLMTVKFSDGRDKLIFYLRDLTDEDGIASELRDARDQAQNDALMKSRFVAVASHELRTPVSNIIAALDQIDLDPESAKQNQLLELARKSATLSLEQINDLLDLSEIRMAPEPSAAFDPIEVAKDVIELHQNLAASQSNKLSLTSSLAGNHALLIGRQKTYRRVLVNLVNNAIKFTSGGFVEINLTTTPGDNGRLILHTAVSDSGKGILKVDQDRIFGEFEIVQNLSDAVPMNGSGLGLAIVKLGVQQMGGSINLDSEVGKGSTFWFDLELTPSEPPAAEPRPMARREKDHTVPAINMLAIDDNPVHRTILASLFAGLGFSFNLAQGGEAGVKLAAAQQFDAILIDINMPDIDGFETARRIRIGGASQGAILLGMTAQVLDGHVKRAESAGLDRILAKPITAAILQAALGQTNPKSKSNAAPCRKVARRSDLTAVLGEDLYNQLVGACVLDCETALTLWPNGGVDEICARFTECVHNGLGSAAILGETDLHEVLRMVEIAALAGNVSKLSTLHDSVEHQLAQLKLH